VIQHDGRVPWGDGTQSKPQRCQGPVVGPYLRSPIHPRFDNAGKLRIYTQNHSAKKPQFLEADRISVSPATTANKRTRRQPAHQSQETRNDRFLPSCHPVTLSAPHLDMWTQTQVKRFHGLFPCTLHFRTMPDRDRPTRIRNRKSRMIGFTVVVAA